jgi:glycogen debranching enzyme
MVLAAGNAKPTSMDDQLVVLRGSSFVVSDRRGDVEAEAEPTGLFVRDVRHLSTWLLTVDGQRTRLLTSRNLGHDTARFFLTQGWAKVGHDPGISICRERHVGERLHEHVSIRNHSGERLRIDVVLEYASDFADIFEVKDQRPKRGRVRQDATAAGATLRYEREDYWRATDIAFDPPPTSMTERSASFDLDLAPGESWEMRVVVTCSGDGVRERAGGRARPPAASPARGPHEPPVLEAASDDLRRTYRQSLADLVALRFQPFVDQPWTPPAAGLPWFMALFGRDSIITSYQALPFDPSLAATTLESLAGLQAREMDDFHDAEPGKIPHELRVGELVRFGEAAQGPYYGTHDATPLFLVLLDEYERWTGDMDLVRRLESTARAAVEWIERYGDLDGDGYLEYRRRSPRGLVNQFWKDSWNSVLFADGTLAEAPIATCDVQAYAYDGLRRTARLARLAWADDGLARRLEARAADLRRRFNEDFWSDRRGHFVLALDGAKRQVDALTSNVGHVLWSGIAEPERAAETVRRLMRPDMHSGWGMRTMSAHDAGYNPISYHDGTVWPHDSGLVAEGFRRYGFREEASTLANGILDAAPFFEHRLPETFAGFGREENPFPVEYPTASRPQGWSAGAPLLALRTLLGLDVVDGALRCEPAGAGEVRLTGVAVRGRRVPAG